MADGDRIVDVVVLMFPFISSVGSGNMNSASQISTTLPCCELSRAEADWTEIISQGSVALTKCLFKSNLSHVDFTVCSDAGALPFKLSRDFEEEATAIDPVKRRYLLVNCKSLI